MDLWETIKNAVSNFIHSFGWLGRYIIQFFMSKFYRSRDFINTVTHSVGQEIAGGTIPKERLHTEEGREALKKIKEKVKHSPSGVVDWVDAVFAPFVGKTAIDNVMETAGIDVSKFPTTYRKLFNVSKTLADASMITGYIDIAGDLTGFAHLKHIGRFIDRVIANSGVMGLTQFGLGTALGNAMSKPVGYSINKQTTPLIPSPGDLVHFMKREVYSKSLTEKVTKEEDLDTITDRVKNYNKPSDWTSAKTVRGRKLVPYPPEYFIKQMKKHGFDRHESESFYASDWEVPSPRYAEDMYARLRPEILKDTWENYTKLLPKGVEKTKDNVLKYLGFNLEDYKRLLRYADFASTYQGRIAAVSKRPYSRVDIRRMYRSGAFMEEVENVEDAVDKKAKKDPQYRDVYRAFLELNYPKKKAFRMAEFYVWWARKDTRDATAEYIIRKYKQDKLSYDESFNLLKDLFPREEYVKQKLQIEKMKGAPRTPSKADVRDWMLTGEITEDRTRTYLDKMGYSVESVNHYINYWKSQGEK